MKQPLSIMLMVGEQTSLDVIISPDDDAARAGLGGTWRMPTDDEWAELRDASNCSWTWITLNGTNGYKVLSKNGLDYVQ